ncbi:uncharacterized protein LOC125487963 [Rhincodon typus]|uniref:uncharacterized protein LOC125487963 n=1 Tax=Rhincodon typus TaxID=259920 RepID=UPI00202F8C3B|nr:uncharacterized protein LOC125487963 [Rhincodon typus]
MRQRGAMRVLLSIFIFCNIIFRAFAIQCKKCVPRISPTCKNSYCFNSNKCLSELSSVNNRSFIIRTCANRAHCGASINTGIVKHSIICCKNDLCNNHTMPERKNGMECYGCTDNSCRENLKSIACTSNQKFCAWGYFKGPYNRFADLLLDTSINMSTNEDQDVESRSIRFPFRGCASPEVCGLPISTVNKISCCCGNLCNRSVSTQHNMLLLLVTGLLPSLRMPL